MGVVVLGTAGVDGATLGGAVLGVEVDVEVGVEVGVEIEGVATDAGPGGVAAATVIDAGGPVIGLVTGPVGDEVSAALEGVALDIETAGVVLGVLGTGTERIAMPTGTVADELTEAGKLAEPVELTTPGAALTAVATGIAAGVTTAGSPLSSSAVVAAVAGGNAAARGARVGLAEIGPATAASDLALAGVSAGSLITSYPLKSGRGR